MLYNNKMGILEHNLCILKNNLNLDFEYNYLHKLCNYFLFHFLQFRKLDNFGNKFQNNWYLNNNYLVLFYLYNIHHQKFHLYVLVNNIHLIYYKHNYYYYLLFFEYLCRLNNFHYYLLVLHYMFHNYYDILLKFFLLNNLIQLLL